MMLLFFGILAVVLIYCLFRFGLALLQLAAEIVNGVATILFRFGLLANTAISQARGHETETCEFCHNIYKFGGCRVTEAGYIICPSCQREGLIAPPRR